MKEEVLKLVKQMCDATVEAAEKGRISAEEAQFRIDLIEATVLGDKV